MAVIMTIVKILLASLMVSIGLKAAAQWPIPPVSDAVAGAIVLSLPLAVAVWLGVQKATKTP